MVDGYREDSFSDRKLNQETPVTESELTEIQGGWKGYEFDSVKRHNENGRHRWKQVYVLKGDLKHLGNFTYPGAAKRFWKQWYRRAMYSNIEALKKFTRQRNECLPGPHSHCRAPTIQASSNGSTTRSKSSSDWHTDSEMTPTSSSK